MFDKFDGALAKLLSGEQTAFGAQDHRIGLAAARQAAADNRVKALNEASLGNVYFAAILENASTRYHEDAEAMAKGQPPKHHSLAGYLKTAETYRKLDLREVQPTRSGRRRVATKVA